MQERINFTLTGKVQKIFKIYNQIKQVWIVC